MKKKVVAIVVVLLLIGGGAFYVFGRGIWYPLLLQVTGTRTVARRVVSRRLGQSAGPGPRPGRRRPSVDSRVKVNHRAERPNPFPLWMESDSAMDVRGMQKATKAFK